MPADGRRDLTLDFKLSPRFESIMYSFGCFPGVWLLYANVSEPSVGSIFKGWKMELEDGNDRGFRNVGKPQSDAGEIPKRIHTKLSSSYSTRSVPAVTYTLLYSTLHFFHPFLRPAYALVSMGPCLVISLLYMLAADGTQYRLANALLDSCRWMKTTRTVCRLYEHFQIETDTFSLMEGHYANTHAESL